MSLNNASPRASSSELEDFHFARQFVAGPKKHLRAPNTWATRSLWENFQLATHPALDVSHAENSGYSVALLGIAIDALDPLRNSSQIAETLAEAATHSIERLIESTDSLGGRWLVIAATRNGTVAFSDPCGQRQIRHARTMEGVWIGSTDAIIRSQTTLNCDNSSALHDFLRDSRQRKNEFAWVGVATPFKDCSTLLPNHYLDMEHGEARRFFPSRQISRQSRDDVVKSASFMLTNLLRGAAGRSGGIMIPVTAGWDSRVLLAASKSVASSDQVTYYIDRMGELPDHHPDIRVPRALSRRLNFKLEVLDSREEPTQQFKEMLGENLGSFRGLPKTRMIYSKFVAKETRLNINGNCSEICRNYYHSHASSMVDAASSRNLARMLGYSNQVYVEHCLTGWLSSLPPLTQSPHLDVLDLLYWEQRMGLWGAQYPAEQDIVIDEISPFNCRALICTLLASDPGDRMAPHYPLYTELIREMWPEAMAEPINPLEYSVGGLKRALKGFYLQYLRPPKVRSAGTHKC